MRKETFFAFLFLLSMAWPVRAQNNPGHCSGKSPSEGFPEANFYGEFRKHDALPFFGWQGRLGLDADFYQRCHKDFRLRVDFQTVGAKSKSHKVNVAGTSYIVEPSYRVTLKNQTDYWSFGFTHLSSHLAEDLVRLVREEQAKGNKIPVIDATDLNVAFVEAGREFRFLPFSPRFRLRIQPIGFRFRAGGYVYDQPVYFRSQWTFWQGKKKGLSFDTTHEWGKSSLNTLSLKLNFFEHTQSEGRLQFFATWVGGNQVFVGPNEGWNHSGWSGGVRVIFQGNQ